MQSSLLVQRIMLNLQQRIRSGELAVGSHLSAQQVADHFQVSRSPAREALAALAVAGVLTQQPRRGYFVGDPCASAPLAQPLAVQEPQGYYLLSDDWLSDRIPQDITEQWVRERYGLGRAQACALLNRATRVGWIAPKPGYGWRLQDIVKTAQAREEVFKVCLLVEPAGLLEPGFRCHKALLCQLRHEQSQLLHEGLEGWAAEALVAVAMRFHEELINCSGNRLYHQLVVQMNQLRRLIEHRSALDHSRYRQHCEERLQILEQVAQGDRHQAAQLMSRHLQAAMAP